MTPATLKDAEENGASVGELPDLDFVAAYYAKLWSTLRDSTPAEHPISMSSIALMVGDGDGLREALPLIQGMDRVLFNWQRGRREEAKKRAEAEAKRKQRGRGRVRGR